MSFPQIDPSARCYKWRVATKPIGRQAKDAAPMAKAYHVTAARAEVAHGHIVFFDDDGSLMHVRAFGTFETVTRVEHADT
jgi:hypothetical protein